MIYWPTLLAIIHVIGLALGVGAATVKLVLLYKSRSNAELIPVFFDVSRIATPLIIAGMIMLTLSGIGWIILGYYLTTVLSIKIGLVLTIWILGPYMDNFVEPKFHKLAMSPGMQGSAEFIRVQKQYLTMEVIATLIFYIIIVFWLITR